MDDEREVAVKALRTLVWEMEELLGRMESAVALAKERIAYIDALENDRKD